MSRKKWISASGNDAVAKENKLRPPTEEELEKYGDEEVVVLLMGFNNFGDKIYNYIKLKFRDYFPMRDGIKKGGKFDIREYGEVVAAGKGEPTAEIRAEVEGQYKFLSFPKN